MDVLREPGAAIGREIATGDRADAQIETFISRRHEQRVKTEGERAEEEAWMESERRLKVSRDAALRAEWCEYHRDQAERHRRNLAALVARHEAAVERLMEGTDQKGRVA